MMTEQQELNMTKAIPTAFDRVRDLAHRGQAIRELMAKEDCDSLVKEILEQEQLRNDKMAHEALQAAILEQHNKSWHPPVGRSFLSILRTGPSLAEIVGSPVKPIKVDISNIPGPAFEVSFGESLAKELEKLGKEAAAANGACDGCEDRDSCFPHGKKDSQIPEEHKALAVIIQEAVSPILGRPASDLFIANTIAKIEAIFEGEDNPDVVTIPPHLMARLEKLMSWSSHDAEEFTAIALNDYLTKLGY